MPFPSLFPNEILLAIFALCSPRTLAFLSRSSFLFLQLANPLLYRDPLEVVIRFTPQLQALFALPETSVGVQLQPLRDYKLQTRSLDRIRAVRILSLLGKPSRGIGRGVVRTKLEVKTLIVDDPVLLVDGSLTATSLRCERLVVYCRTSSNKEWAEFSKTYKWRTELPYLACREVVLIGGELVGERAGHRWDRQSFRPFPAYSGGKPIRFLLFPRTNHDQASPSWEKLHREFATSRQDMFRNGGSSVAGRVVIEVVGEVEREWVESGFEISSLLTPVQKRIFRVAVRESKDLWEDVE